ncbi:helix-turn-helix transcriptional regulator [Solibacillus sp. CAU 1738]|uniref:helix-turn-helix domain-containing protein n=1 Tax=Solibacillus sp. CAU 1738 TaxID=3140363 RepID=UPI003260B7AE
MHHLQFSMNFALRRKEMGVTQEQVAQYIGVSKAAVSKWEKGLSYPDITLLPKLATYFNLSIDALLGYEPQMTKEHIQKTYAELAKKFSEKSFSEVQTEIEALLAEYYACFPFVLTIAQLYLNYVKQSEHQQEVLNRVLELCERVIVQSNDYRLMHEAELLKAYVMLLQGKPEEVLNILGEEIKIQYGAEQLIATALSMLGKIDKSKETLQVGMYQHMLGTISNATETLQFETSNSEYFDKTVHRIEAMLSLFNISQLNINASLVFYLKAAAGYMMQQREDDALNMLEKYCKVCDSLNFPLKLSGDDYFYLLDEWIARDINLGAQAPRDDVSIKREILSSISEQPIFASLQQNSKFKALLNNLAHRLQLKEE